jgi:hypothetical protein
LFQGYVLLINPQLRIGERFMAWITAPSITNNFGTSESLNPVDRFYAFSFFPSRNVVPAIPGQALGTNSVSPYLWNLISLGTADSNGDPTSDLIDDGEPGLVYQVTNTENDSFAVFTTNLSTVVDADISLRLYARGGNLSVAEGDVLRVTLLKKPVPFIPLIFQNSEILRAEDSRIGLVTDLYVIYLQDNTTIAINLSPFRTINLHVLQSTGIYTVNFENSGDPQDPIISGVVPPLNDSAIGAATWYTFQSVEIEGTQHIVCGGAVNYG